MEQQAVYCSCVSQIIEYIRTYSTRFDISNADRRRLIAHYPLIRAAATGATARWPLKPLQRYEVPHTLSGGVHATLPLDPFGYASFAEIFFLDEYPVEPPVESFVDLGGNIGMASLLFFACGARSGLTVEANPALMPGLRQRLSSVNGQSVIENAAISSCDGPIPFKVTSNHRLSAIGAADDGDALLVPAVALGPLLKRHDIERATLLKMDIEGAEFDVLANSAEELLRFEQLFVEIHGGPTQWERFKSGLRSLGFSITDYGASPESLTVHATR